MGEWSFCPKCGWHSTGNFDECPGCDSKDVHHMDNDLPLDAKTPLFANYDKPESIDASKEKKKAG
jgi:hypothetical protein